MGCAPPPQHSLGLAAQAQRNATPGMISTRLRELLPASGVTLGSPFKMANGIVTCLTAQFRVQAAPSIDK
eukprot:26027-Amphidinium_carterae.1